MHGRMGEGGQSCQACRAESAMQGLLGGVSHARAVGGGVRRFFPPCKGCWAGYPCTGCEVGSTCQGCGGEQSHALTLADFNHQTVRASLKQKLPDSTPLLKLETTSVPLLVREWQIRALRLEPAGQKHSTVPCSSWCCNCCPLHLPQQTRSMYKGLWGRVAMQGLRGGLNLARAVGSACKCMWKGRTMEGWSGMPGAEAGVSHARVRGSAMQGLWAKGLVWRRAIQGLWWGGGGGSAMARLAPAIHAPHIDSM